IKCDTAFIIIKINKKVFYAILMKINYSSRYMTILINDMTFASRREQVKRPTKQDWLFNVCAKSTTTFELEVSSGIIALRFVSSGPL
ncbi:hypothetical protein EJQ17_17035, partial [Salmonella enterica]|nr:hypothetical protein [Salmonella enterica]